MYLQIAYHDELHLPNIDLLSDLVDQLNSLLGKDTYIIENNGRRVNVAIEQSLGNDENYRIWPRVLGGKVSSLFVTRSIRRLMPALGRLRFFVAFVR
jgi:hypothetical protein